MRKITIVANRRETIFWNDEHLLTQSLHLHVEFLAGNRHTYIPRGIQFYHLIYASCQHELKSPTLYQATTNERPPALISDRLACFDHALQTLQGLFLCGEAQESLTFKIQ